MAFVGEGGIELTDATAFIVAAKEESANGTHKRHQNGSGDEEETKALKAHAEVMEDGVRAVI